MWKIYYNRIVLGNLKYSDFAENSKVPDSVKEKVLEALIENGFEDLLNE